MFVYSSYTWGPWYNCTVWHNVRFATSMTGMSSVAMIKVHKVGVVCSLKVRKQGRLAIQKSLTDYGVDYFLFTVLNLPHFSYLFSLYDSEWRVEGFEKCLNPSCQVHWLLWIGLRQGVTRLLRFSLIKSAALVSSPFGLDFWSLCQFCTYLLQNRVVVMWYDLKHILWREQKFIKLFLFLFEAFEIVVWIWQLLAENQLIILL